MELRHLFQLPLQANPSRLDPCVNQNFFVLPVTKTIIGVWDISRVKQSIRDKSKPQHLELDGHTKTINALAFTNGTVHQLASSCSEKILLWDFQSSEIKSTVFFSNPGEIDVMGFNNNDNLIAAGKGSKIYVIQNGKPKVNCVLEMHNAMITALKFCPHFSATLISISDDRTCCIWDVKDSVLLYQSSILSSSPLLSMAMSLVNPCVAIGSGDGKLFMFDLTSGHDFRQLSNLDIVSIINKKNEQMKHSKVNSGAEKNQDVTEVFAEASESILSIEYAYFCQTKESFEAVFGQNISGAGEILKDIPPSLNMITTNFFVQINSRTLEIINVINLNSSIDSEAFLSSITVGSISYAAARQINPFQMFVTAGTLFDRKIHVLEWCFHNENHKSASVDLSDNTDFHCEHASEGELNIIATNTLEVNSPLKAEMLPPVLKNPTTKGDIATGKKKASSKMNQPLTFKSTVKSSGYTQAPRTTMFKPETSRQKLLNLSGHVKKSSTTKTMAVKMLQSNCDDLSWHVNNHVDTLEVDSEMSAVFNVRFSDDGTALACALANKTALIVKSPFSRHICTSLIGHNHSINSVHWSNCNSYILTASNDKTVRLWETSGGDPFMIMTHKNGTPKEGQNDSKKAHTSKMQKSLNSSASVTSTTRSNDNKPFLKEITKAQFYYMDKFILATHGSDLSLFKYCISPDTDDLKRYQTRNRYKLVENWTSSSSFSSSIAVNNFFSHLVLCTTSGKCIEVYDINKSCLSHTFKECHSRPPHCITINEGSYFSSQSSQAYNVIATIAPTDPIKLWDLRSKSCIQALVGHQNKAHMCQISFSPCGNYLATGSEDRFIYVFDLRIGTFCEKLKGASDVVCSTAFSPAKALLAAGSLDGKILWYN